MRKTLKQILPSHESVHNNRWLRPFAGTLLHPRLWHLNRHSAAGAVAVGLFCGLVPGPLQMISAALACVLLRVNLPLALITTLYSNPFTIAPLYLAAYALGSLVINGRVDGFVEPPEMSGMDLLAWIGELSEWVVGLGKPLALGLVLLGSGLAMIGYFGVKAAWRLRLVRAWRRRQQR